MVYDRTNSIVDSDMRRPISGVTISRFFLCVALIIQTVRLCEFTNKTSEAFEGGVSNSKDFGQQPTVISPVKYFSAAIDNEQTIESINETSAPTSTGSSDGSAGSIDSQDTQPPSEQSSSSLASEESIDEQRDILPFENSHSTRYESSKSEDVSASSCAILFFGLPRSFKLFVLPSIIENIILPNMDNNCDYYLHFFAITSEGENRAGEAGGTIHGNDVFLLEDAIRNIYERETVGRTGKGIPHVSITNSTLDEFEQSRGQLLHSYEKTRGKNGKYLYFPYKAASWEYPNTLRNMVKQWHSIDAVWQHMETNARFLNKNYSRVAMLRNDVMYVTPVDVYQLSTYERDVDNNYFVVPDWANYPVNDRMVAGPYDAVKIWATERFQRIESHVRNYPIPGWGMHSERFMNYSIFPAMLNASRQTSSSLSMGYKIDQNPNVCFLRARADGSVWIEDCNEKINYNMEPVVRKLLAKYHNIANSSNVSGVNCKRKSIGGIKYQDVVSCRGNTSFLVL